MMRIEVFLLMQVVLIADRTSITKTNLLFIIVYLVFERLRHFLSCFMLQVAIIPTTSQGYFPSLYEYAPSEKHIALNSGGLFFNYYNNNNNNNDDDDDDEEAYDHETVHKGGHFYNYRSPVSSFSGYYAPYEDEGGRARIPYDSYSGEEEIDSYQRPPRIFEPRVAKDPRRRFYYGN